MLCCLQGPAYMHTDERTLHDRWESLACGVHELEVALQLVCRQDTDDGRVELLGSFNLASMV
jgi:hypothetical protein